MPPLLDIPLSSKIVSDTASLVVASGYSALGRWRAPPSVVAELFENEEAEMVTSPLMMESAPPAAPLPLATLFVKLSRVRTRVAL